MTNKRKVPTVRRRLNLTKLEYYKYHLKIINPMLPSKLTEKEIEVLALFISYDGIVAKKDRFGASIRKLVRKQTGISFSGLSFYIKSLKKKGFIYFDKDKELRIWKLAFPALPQQKYQFEINLIEENNG
jgi:DNA-binding MarR family transcriptional regulator